MVTFILIFGLFSFIEIYEHRNPQITQFTIYEKRYKAQEFNFGELYGAIAFGFQNPKNLNFVEVDPKYGSLSLHSISQDWIELKITVEKEFEMVTLNPRDHPDYFPKDMSPELRAAFPELTGCYTPKNPSEITIRDNSDSENGILLAIYFSKCK